MTVPIGDVRRVDPQDRTTFSASVVAGIRHEPSADFLRNVGIPARPNPWFNLVDGSPEQVRTLGDACASDDIALDGVTGVVYCLPGDESEKERPNYDFESELENIDPASAAARLTEQMREIDPAALDVSNSRWHDILEHVAEPEAR